MSILNRAITCQAVPDVPKPANVEAQPEEPSGDMIQPEMDLLSPRDCESDDWNRQEIHCI